MKATSKKITYAALLTAISVVCMVISQFIPLIVIAPLIISALCVFLAFDKCGIIFGFLSGLASLLIIFFIGGISSTFLFGAIVFIPYGILSYFIRPLSFRGIKIIFRLLLIIVFINIALAAIFFLTKYLVYDFSFIASKLGGYWVLALIVTLIAVLFDFIFNELCKFVSKRVK